MAGDSRNSSTSLVYDPKTGKWVASTSVSSSSSSSDTTEEVPSSSTENESTSKVDSQTKADKEFIENEFNTLVGELTVIPSAKNIMIKVNNTVNLSGVGSHLSGQYFVSSVKRTLSADSGYSQTLTVLKNGFDDSLKNNKKVDLGTAVKSVRNYLVSLVKKEAKVGDKVTIVGNAVDITGQKIPSWVKSMNLTVKKVSSDNSKVLLSPASVWTYSQYVKKK